MRTPFVLVDDDLGGAGTGATVRLREDQVHHLVRVLRRRDGDDVRVGDGHGSVAVGRLEGSAVVLTESVQRVDPPAPRVTIVHALPKGRAFDDAVRTLCELGVASVEPVLTARTVVRPTGEKARSVGARLRSVAVSAAEQAQSAHLCVISDPRALEVTEREVPEGVLALVAHPDAAVRLGEVMPPDPPVSALWVLIGPEGGLTDEEVGGLAVRGWQPVRVGDTVLRSVHAAPVVTAAVLALSGRFGPAPTQRP